MDAQMIRAQVTSEAKLITELKTSADGMEISDHALPESDQNFGLVEAAAVVALATSVAKLAEVLVKVYKDINDDNLEVTIKTAGKSLTVKGKTMRNVTALIDEFQQAE